MTLVCGIDPGIHGGIALVSSEHGLLHADDMPVTDDKVSPVLVTDWFRQIAPHEPDLVVIEKVHAMPRQGVSSSFGFGRSLGVVEGVVGALGFRVQMVTPQAWKKGVGIVAGADKDASRTRALELWPEAADLFRRKKDADRAEAALMAWWAAS